MADIEYVKNYKEKELRQYVLAYLLVTVTFVGFHTITHSGAFDRFEAIFQMIITDIFVGAICVLVLIFNELWSDRTKTKLVYGEMPSGTVFTDIASGKIDATGFDLDKAKELYMALADESESKQTAEWNLLLRKSRETGRGNVIEAQRMQLMTRDICMSTISLLILNIIAIGVLAIVHFDIIFTLKMMAMPIIYLIVMLIITKIAAQNRARRFVALVIKNDVQDS